LNTAHNLCKTIALYFCFELCLFVFLLSNLKDSMNTTNYIQIPSSKAYLIPFIDKMLGEDHPGIKKFKKGLYDLLKVLVRTAPEDYIPKSKAPKDCVNFSLPAWTDINTDYRYYLSPTAGAVVYNYIWKTFWVIYDLHMKKMNRLSSKKNATYLFIEQYNLSLDNYDMLIRRDRRMRKNLISKKTLKTASVFKLLLSAICPLLISLF